MSKWFYGKVLMVQEYMVEVEDQETEEDAEKAILSEVFDWDEIEVEPIKPESVNQYQILTDRDKILYLPKK